MVAKISRLNIWEEELNLGEIEANVSSIDGVDENCCVFDSAKKENCVILFWRN